MDLPRHAWRALLFVAVVGVLVGCDAAPTTPGTNQQKTGIIPPPSFRLTLDPVDGRTSDSEPYTETKTKDITKNGSGLLSTATCSVTSAKGMKEGFARLMTGTAAEPGSTTGFHSSITSEAYLFDTPENALAAFNSWYQCANVARTLTRVRAPATDIGDQEVQVTVDSGGAEDARIFWVDRNAIGYVSFVTSTSHPTSVVNLAKLQDSYFPQGATSTSDTPAPS